MGQERITMTRKELKRYIVIIQHIQGLMAIKKAAIKLGLSTR
jgi:hypothetical protein